MNEAILHGDWLTQRFFIIRHGKNMLTWFSIYVVNGLMKRRPWLLGLLGTGLGLSAGCGSTETNKPMSSTSGLSSGSSSTTSSTSATSSGDPGALGPLRIAYGPGPLQFGDLRLPSGTGPHPVIVVLHGGCWINFYGLDLMHDMSAALTAEGFATWNVEYRRLGDADCKYPNTFLDVGMAVDHVRKLAVDHPLDLSRVTTVGHSAGGHLAVWVAARQKLNATNPLHGTDPLPIKAAVSLAGVLDLAESLNLGVCNGTASQLLEGTPSEVPARYAEASPRQLLPIGVSQKLVHGNADTLVPLVMSQHYWDAAKGAGEANVTLDVIDGADHFDVITPSSTKWPAVLKVIVDVAQ